MRNKAWIGPLQNLDDLAVIFGEQARLNEVEQLVFIVVNARKAKLELGHHQSHESA